MGNSCLCSSYSISCVVKIVVEVTLIQSNLKENIIMEITDNFELEQKRFAVEYAEKWKDLIKDIPAISFKSEWKIKIIPPFGGAIARFQVMRPNNEQSVSVYLDFYSRLGCMPEPYWEVYPINDDVARVDMNDVEGLLDLIEQSMNSVD